MLLILPVAILFLTSLAILLLIWLHPSFRYNWLIAAGGSLFAWIGMLVLGLRLPLQFTFVIWRPVELFSSSPAFLLDSISWPYGVAMGALSVSVILTATARTQYNTQPLAWAGSLGMAGLGLLAALAGNPLTLMMTWSALDLAEVCLLLFTVPPEGRFGQRTVLGYAARVAGILLVWWAVVSGHQAQGALTFTGMQPRYAILLFLAASLRLGVLPLHVPFPVELPLRKGLGNVIRFAPAISSLALLARMPAQVIPAGWQPVILILLFLACYYGAVMWLFSSDEISGRAYWVISMAALAAVTVSQGMPAASISWGLALLLVGSSLMLYHARSRGMIPLVILGAWCISGLPFSPAAVGWQGLMGKSPWVGILLIPAYACLVAGYTRHNLRPGDPYGELERWAQVMYPLGLYLLPLVYAGWSILNWRDLRQAGLSWPGFVFTLVAVVVGFYTYRFQPPSESVVETSPNRPSSPGLSRIARTWASIFRLDWLYQMIWLVFGWVESLLDGFTGILEGDGGVLWVLVLLVLLISLLRPGGTG